MCDRSLIGIAGSNLVGAMISLSLSLSLSLVSDVKQRSLKRADPSSRGILFSVFVSLSVIRCNNRLVYLKLVVKKEVSLKKKQRKII